MWRVRNVGLPGESAFEQPQHGIYKRWWIPFNGGGDNRGEDLAITRICAARSPTKACVLGVWLERRSAMYATVGDKVHIKSRNVGMHEHVGEVLEVRGPEGEPPYVVRFSDGHESLVYPGPDCIVEQRGPAD